MPDFLFQLKGKNSEGFSSNWVWPPIWTDKVSALNKKEAHKIIEESFDKKFPLRVLQKDLDSNEFLLIIKEIKADDKYTTRLFDPLICKQCDKEFTVIEKYNQGNPGGGNEFCSYLCSSEFNRVERLRYNGDVDLQGIHPPVIYRITNKITGKCYIGKTTQAFTLRWYQHFFQGGGTKFHEEIKSPGLINWIFEVIEIIEIPKELKSISEVTAFIFEREMYHISTHNSIENGYNSLPSKIIEQI